MAVRRSGHGIGGDRKNGPACADGKLSQQTKSQCHCRWSGPLVTEGHAQLPVEMSKRAGVLPAPPEPGEEPPFRSLVRVASS